MFLKFSIQLFIFNIFIFLVFNCSDPKEPDNIPPSVSILSPLDGSTVSEVVAITCLSTDSDKVYKVELWVDGVSTGVIDYSEPYSLDWNTTTYQNNSSYIITVRSYDMSNNKKDSEPITLIVDNTNSNPSIPEIKNIFFHNNSFNIKWFKNEDSDFFSYTLYESVNSDMSNKNEMYNSTDINDTTYIITGITFDEYRYFDLKVTDIYGFSSVGSIHTGSSYLKIVYNSSREGKEDICIVDINGNAKVNLTKNSHRSFNPNYSHDGSKIIYTAIVEGDQEIFIMDADGNNKIRLTYNAGDDGGAQFSPDDSKIVFCSLQSHHRQIYIMDNDGSNQINLSNNNSVEGYPQFSIDGSKIVFVSERDGNYEIYMMNVDGSNQINLTNNNDYDTRPTFSPDGSIIIFRSYRTGVFTLYSMNVDGSNQLILTTLPGEIDKYDISPDGSKIAFQYSGTSSFDIYLMDINGNNPHNLTNSHGWEPNFSPDGSKIVFSTSRDGNGEIYLMNIDGSNQINLTNDNYSDERPRFQPNR